MSNPPTVGGLNETDAAAIFEPMAHFVLGCQMASLVIDTFLGGVLAMQTLQYFQYQSNDKLWVRLLVTYTALMNVVITIYYWVFTQDLFIQNFGVWLPWLEVHWLAYMPTFDGMTVSVVQSFFAYRAFLLTKRNWFVLITAGCLILVAFGGAIGTTVIFVNQPSLLQASVSGPALITWLSATTAADILIAGCILWGLFQSKSGWAHTDKLVGRLIRLTFEAQIPPTFLAMAYVAEWAVQPDSLLGAVFQAVQSKAYTVGLLFSLNARITFVRASEDNTVTGAPQVFGMKNRPGQPTEIQVEVQTETYVHGNRWRDDTTVKPGDVSLDEFDMTKALDYSNNSKSQLVSPDSHV